MPNPQFRHRLLKKLIAFTQCFGTRLRDVSGNTICRAFMIPWRGRTHLIGLPPHVQIRPVPLPQSRLSYWKQTIAWEQPGPPDFPRLADPPPSAPVKACHVVICHLPPEGTAAVYDRWRASDPSSPVLIAYGGTRANFESLDPRVAAMYVEDGSLRTVGHVTERQSYKGVFQAAREWLSLHGGDVTHVHVVEYDVVPFIPDVGVKLASVLRTEDADICGYGLVDLSGTLHPHNLYEISNVELLGYLASISRREVKDRIISMLGCSSFCTRAAFEAIAALDYPSVYLEVAISTLAHHSGYRVRPVPPEQQRFVSFQGDFSADFEEYGRQGAWMVHPCKTMWTSPVTPR